jgi:2-dehydro-3-deoxy-D-arabinonate dehydratase
VPLCLYRAASPGAPSLGLIVGDRVHEVAGAGGPATLAGALALPVAELRERLGGVAAAGGPATSLAGVTLAAPVDRQEVWAAGVTYLRSRDARMEESTQADVYDRVYGAERPEVFLKATPGRVVGPGGAVAIRGDSTWDVPEPELALVLNRHGETVGYTVGNDVSSRSIEGENPIYLPQAKIYSACAALGPTIALAWEVSDPLTLPIRLTIRRGGEVLFAGETSTDQLHRPLPELVSYLFRHQAEQFADGVVLMTGTGIIPPPEFTLQDGDHVRIAIDGVGTLDNPVVRLA